MKCLTEVASVTVTHYDEKFVGELVKRESAGCFNNHENLPKITRLF